MPELRPLREADLSRVEAVFSDVDGTLTTGGRLRASTLGMMEQLDRAGVPVVLVTGRPAGFAEAWARTLPVAGVIAENGGLAIRLDGRGALRKTYARPALVRARERRRLERVVQSALRAVPGARMSTDSRYTEVDLAIDVNEEVRLGPEAARRLEAFFTARGVNAVRSSVHVNVWIGPFDKAWMVRRFARLGLEDAALPGRSPVRLRRRQPERRAAVRRVRAERGGGQRPRGPGRAGALAPASSPVPRRARASRSSAAPVLAGAEGGSVNLRPARAAAWPRTSPPGRTPLGVPQGGGEGPANSARERGGPDRGREVRRPRLLRSASSAIAVRVLTRDPREVIDGDFFRRRVARGLGAAASDSWTGPAPTASGSSTARRTGSRAWWRTSTRARWC